jgi:DMSO/TMAO reductase YedYZ molybdopterin-dependent catalytic subunit
MALVSRWRGLARRRAFLGMVGLTAVTLAGRVIYLPRAPVGTDDELEAYWARQTVEPYTGSPLDDRRVWQYRFTGFLPDLRLNSVEGEQQYDGATFRLRIGGLVSRPAELTVDDLWRLPAETQVSDFYCVDGWAVQGLEWRGVRVRTLLELVGGPRPEATYLGLRSLGGVYSESVPLEVALRDDVMLATDLRGERLPARHGAPVRLLVPPMYGYKSIKWVEHIDLLPKIHLGYWERRGYHPDAWLPFR